MKKEDILYSGQLIEILEKKLDELEQAYNFKDISKFNRIKKEILDLQGKLNISLT